MNKIYYLFSIFLFCSCASIFKNESGYVKFNTPIYRLVNTLNKQCFDVKNPQFLIDFSSKDKGFEIQLEGIWINNYSQLKIQMTDIFGESLFNLILQDHVIILSQKNSKLIEDKNIVDLLNFLKSVGSKNLRRIFHGNYAFKNENIIKIDKDATKELKLENYFAENKIIIDDHELKIKSKIILEKKDFNNLDYELKISSEFYYGLLNSNLNFQLKWLGVTKNNKISPNIIEIMFEKKNYTLKFLDYQ